ncbi:MAG: hypothetical protein ACYC4P_13505 [Thermoanaerobaculia bacterium]
MIGVSVSTLQNWEQRTTSPRGSRSGASPGRGCRPSRRREDPLAAVGARRRLGSGALGSGLVS